MTQSVVEEGLSIQEIKVDGYKKILKIEDVKSGLRSIICIHNTELGPALGGTRIYPYPTFESALTDVLRLAKGMTYKSAVAGVGLGGGKSVIICDQKGKTKEKLRVFAQVIDSLKGEYTAAEDVGCSLEDATSIAAHTPYVVGIKNDKSSGNPAPFTAWGTFRGIQSALKKKFGTNSVEGRTIAIQGLGSVGALLADFLFWHGAKLIISDVDWEKTVSLARKYGALACPAEDILSQKCDVLAPCALGGIINPDTIDDLQCLVIAGCANNQLLSDEDGNRLTQKGILYAPDFVINAGGLINVAQEIEPSGYDAFSARKKVNQIYDQLLSIYEIAEKEKISTNQAAIVLGDKNIQEHVGRRKNPLCYHHYSRVECKL